MIFDIDPPYDGCNYLIIGQTLEFFLFSQLGSGFKCAEGISSGRRQVKWVLLGTWTANWRPGVKDLTDYLGRQYIPKWDSSNGERVLMISCYDVSVGGTYRRGLVRVG